MVDLRYARTSQHRTRLQAGQNKLRYGGVDLTGDGAGDRSQHVLAIPQASLLLDADLPLEASFHAQANLEADTGGGGGGVGLIEAFASGEREFRGNEFALRAGAFIPPISLEHPGRAWSTKYTITPSAIGSWIGEEVRAFGAEAGWRRGFGDFTGGAKAALFAGGDQTGQILLYRGWGLHDRQSALDEAIPVGGGLTDYPFRELDGRLGVYLRTDWSYAPAGLRFASGYWDNQGDINAKSSLPGVGVLETWRTQFWDFGLKWERGRYAAAWQYMKGFSAAPSCPRWEWSAWYALASARFGSWTLSGRLDRFGVNHRRWEKGAAFTLDAAYHVSVRQTAAVEYVHVDARPNLTTRPASQRDGVLQFNYRVLF